jgi:hypothetical protein
MFIRYWAEIEDIRTCEKLMEAYLVTLGIETFTAEFEYESTQASSRYQNTHLGFRSSLTFFLQRFNYEHMAYWNPEVSIGSRGDFGVLTPVCSRHTRRQAREHPMIIGAVMRDH